MDLNNIKTIIEKVITGKISSKTVLIDGPWGCGKTTVLKNAIDDIEKNSDLSKTKIVYQSLFGVKDINELTKCFSNVGKNFYKIGKSLVTPFFQFVPLVGPQISEGLNNLGTEYELSSAIKKNILFIFDDLERVDKELSYISILGFFNQLLLKGCKIICLSSLSDMTKAECNKISEISYFIEKSFDRIYHINEEPEAVIKALLNEAKLDVKLIDACVPIFDKNLRTVIKVKNLLIEIKENEKDNNYSLEKKYTQLQILKACIVAIKSIYIGLEDDKDNKKTKVDYSSVQLKKRVEKWLDKDFLMITKEERDGIKTLSTALCKTILYDDYNDLSSLCPLKMDESKSKSNDNRYTSIYYLNEEDRTLYLNEFKTNTINGKYQIDRQYVDRVIEIIKYTKFDLYKDNFIDVLINKIADNAISGDEEALKRLHDYVEIPLEAGNPEIVKDIYNKASDKVMIYRKNVFTKEIETYYKNLDYSSLIYVIYDIDGRSEKDYIKKCFNGLILDNNFYLPDLYKSLDPNEWSYCHEIARYCFKNKALQESFVNYLKSVAIKHPEKEATIDKVFSLVKYNCDNPIIVKEFSEYIDNIKLKQ